MKRRQSIKFTLGNELVPPSATLGAGFISLENFGRQVAHAPQSQLTYGVMALGWEILLGHGLPCSPVLPCTQTEHASVSRTS